jgi:hypothetical protein
MLAGTGGQISCFDISDFCRSHHVINVRPWFGRIIRIYPPSAAGLTSNERTVALTLFKRLAPSPYRHPAGEQRCSHCGKVHRRHRHPSIVACPIRRNHAERKRRSAGVSLRQNALAKLGAAFLRSERCIVGETVSRAGWPFVFSRETSHSRKYSSSFEDPPLHSSQLGTVMRFVWAWRRK